MAGGCNQSLTHKPHPYTGTVWNPNKISGYGTKGDWETRTDLPCPGIPDSGQSGNQSR
jgi:hypothetical protein